MKPASLVLFTAQLSITKHALIESLWLHQEVAAGAAIDTVLHIGEVELLSEKTTWEDCTVEVRVARAVLMHMSYLYCISLLFQMYPQNVPNR